MKRFVVLVFSLLLLAGVRAVAQSSDGRHQDSVLRRGWAPGSWKRLVPGLRVAGGFQRSWFLEAGISLQQVRYSVTDGLVHRGFYLSGSWVPPAYGEKSIPGLGGGGEMGGNGATVCIDLRYYSDGGREDVTLTPRCVYGLMFIDIGYGYNFSFNNRPFPQIGRHQFIARVNTNVFVHNWQRKARLRRAGNVAK